MGYNRIAELRSKLDHAKGKRDGIQDTIKNNKNFIEKNNIRLIKCQKAQVIIQIVSQDTQSQLEYRLNELVSLAMSAIFQDEAYSLKMRFDIKRGRTEASPLFVRGGKERRPMYGTGFGAADVASFALRPTLWSLEEPRKMPCFLWDEPFRHLNDPTFALHKRAVQMIQEMSKKLGIQIIIVTQNEALCKAGDTVFEIDKDKNGRSLIKEA